MKGVHILENTVGGALIASCYDGFVNLCHHEKEDILLECVVVGLRRGTWNHYAFIDVSTDEAKYRGEEPWTSLEKAVKWVAGARNAKKHEAIAREYGSFEIFPRNHRTNDWIRSYMPYRRIGITKEVRDAVYAKCHGHCAYCGKAISIDEMQVDHVESHYRHQGKDDIDNYLPSCRDCNGLKSDYSLEEFRNVLIPNCAKRNAFGRNDRAARICKAYKLNAFRKTRITFFFEKEETK